MLNKNFTIPLADEPYLDTVTANKSHPGTYTGPKYLKISVDAITKYVERVVAGADSLDAINEILVPQEEGKTIHILDANTNTFEAAYLTGLYTTGLVPNYVETLPTVDDEGNPETWEYGWDDNTGMIQQQYYNLDLKFVNGAFVKPRFRIHALTRSSFLASMELQITNITNALANNDTLTDEAKAQLETYKTWLQNLPTKYANVSHWKIPFKLSVPIY